MNVLMATSEMAPLAQTGGLGEVLRDLPRELTAQGHNVSVVLPYYRHIKENRSLTTAGTGVQVSVPIGNKRVTAEILETRIDGGPQVFLIRRDEYFDRSAVYGDGGHEYDDNAERFIFFNKAVVELARRMQPAPQVIHSHDWTAALIPLFVRDQGLPFGTVLTIHNLAFQGSYWGYDFGLTNLPSHYFGPRGVEYFGRLNFLKAGILFADRVTTVSEQYAHEIQSAEFGCGMDPVLREHAHKLCGIVNGADYAIWDPASDRQLKAPFSADDPSNKSECRAALLRDLKLKKNPQGPVFAMVSRITRQKGFEILLPVVDLLMAFDVRLVVVGDGQLDLHRALRILHRRHAGKFVYVPEYSEKLAHRINAGTDVILAPSRFEPFGLAAVYGLRYGAVPLVHGTGGLFEIVRDVPPGGETGNGFVFYHHSPEGLWDAIRRCMECHANTNEWHQLVQRAMRSDFSWKRSAAHYAELYAQVAAPAKAVA